MTPNLRRDLTATAVLVNAESNSSALPSQLQDSVPYCAQNCLSSLIGQEFSCTSGSFSCLCSQQSSEGYTLGELAYGCTQSYCSSPSTDLSTSLYNVCNSQPSAAVPTHSTILLPAITTSLQSSRSTSSSTSTSLAPSSSGITSAAAGGTTPSAQPSSAASEASQTMTSSPSAIASSHSTDLTPAQATGISVAAMGTIMLAIALILLIGCVRRRHAKHLKPVRDSYDFVDEAPPRFSPFKYGHADPRGPLGGFAKMRSELPNEKMRYQWYGQREKSYPQARETQLYEAEKVYTPEARRRSVSQDRRSRGSMRTVSQLLPEKPSAILNSPPRRFVTPASPATVFEEDPLSPQFPKRISYAVPPAAAHVNPTWNSHESDSPEQSSTTPERVRQPSLSLEIPRVAVRGSRVQPPAAPPRATTAKSEKSLPPDPRASSDSRVRSTQSSNSYIPHYYTRPDSESSDGDSPTPIEEQRQKRKAVPAHIIVTKPTYPPLAVRSSSADSDTSFESTDPDEPTPPENEDKSLSPVVESPLSAVRYPKIPRPSNQAVPRSPKASLSPRHLPQPDTRPVTPQQSIPSPPRRPSPSVLKQDDGAGVSSSSSTSLAAKRRGSKVFHELESGLHIKDSAHSHYQRKAPSPRSLQRQATKSSTRKNEQPTAQDSPLKGYGRSANGRMSTNRRPSYSGGGYGPLPSETQSPRSQVVKTPAIRGQDVVLKSPLWEPKLTPSRKGDDLFLSVGVATPGAAPRDPAWNHFQ